MLFVYNVKLGIKNMVVIRPERNADVDATRQVSEEAFGGEAEARLVDRLRQ